MAAPDVVDMPLDFLEDLNLDDVPDLIHPDDDDLDAGAGANGGGDDDDDEIIPINDAGVNYAAHHIMPPIMNLNHAVMLINVNLFHVAIGHMNLHHYPVLMGNHHVGGAAGDDDDEEEEGSDGEVDPEKIAGLAPELESRALSVRRDDASTSTTLYVGSGLERRAWRQLGRWTGRSTRVRCVVLSACHLRGGSMADFADGLSANGHVEEFELNDVRLRGGGLTRLVPFLRDNRALRTLSIDYCLNGSRGSVELLTAALRGRAASLRNLSLDGNALGVVAESAAGTFDDFVNALMHNSELTRFSLMRNGIGRGGCVSLGRMLVNPKSKLRSLVLRHNCIDDECAVILAESLRGNGTLNNIDLDRNDLVGTRGLMAFLALLSGGTPAGKICLVVRWRCPDSRDLIMRTAVTVKLNDPLREVLRLIRQGQGEWDPERMHDLSRIYLALDGTTRLERLDCKETPFYYNMKDGDLIDIKRDSLGLYSAGDDNGEARGESRAVDDAPPTTASSSPASGEMTIRDTIAANHTLSSLGYETALRRNVAQGALLREFLEANRAADVRSTLRIKVFRCHVEQSLSLDGFAEMDSVMHRVIPWVGSALSEADEGRTYLSVPPAQSVRFQAIYHLLRAMPMLCGYQKC